MSSPQIGILKGGDERVDLTDFNHKSQWRRWDGMGNSTSAVDWFLNSFSTEMICRLPNRSGKVEFPERLALTVRRL